MSLGTVKTTDRIYTLNDDWSWTIEPDDTLLRPGIEVMTRELSGPAAGIPGRMALAWVAQLVKGKVKYAEITGTPGRIY